MVVSLKKFLVVVLHLPSIFSHPSPDEKCYHGFFLENSQNIASKCAFSWRIKATHRVKTMNLKNGKIDWNCNPETAWGAVLPSIVILSKVPPIEGFTVGPIAPGGVVELDDDREERLLTGETTIQPVRIPFCRWKRIQRGRKMISCFCFVENCADISENNIMEIFEDGCNRGEDRESRCVMDHFPDKECFKLAIKRAMQTTTENPADGITATSLLPEITAKIEEFEEEVSPPADNPFDTGFVIKIVAGSVAIVAVFLATAACVYVRQKKKKMPGRISEKEDNFSEKN